MRESQAKMQRVLIGICLSLSMLCGCTSQMDNIGLYDDTGKWSSSIAGVSDTSDVACIDDTIAYYTSKYVCFYDIKTENIITDTIPEWNQPVRVSAGKKYFYVLVRDYESAVETPPCYLRIYTTDGSLFKEMEVPFQEMFVSNGIIYTYWADYEMDGFEQRKGHIEATHYLSEKKFLADFPDKVSDWNEMVGDTMQVASKTFYRYPADGYMHTGGYYSDDKYLDIIQQFYFTECMDGEWATPREIDAEYLEQLYGMMKKKEKNWITFATEVDGIMYGVCNIYESSSGFMSQMNTSCIDYSISFCYNEDTNTLEKINKYEDVELIYDDGEHVITHKEDGVYYIDLPKDKEEKLLDCDGAIGVTVRDNLLLVKKNESYTGEGDEEEVYWGKDTMFVKKLW